MPKATAPLLDNATARRIFLQRHGLSGSPIGAPALGDIIADLGFVQLDSINTVARAHHMILRARQQSYRQEHLDKYYAGRHLFEHWTHDASVIPMTQFPQWRLKCARDAKTLRSRYKNWRRDGFEAKFDEVLQRISDVGPCSSGDVGQDEERSKGGWWDWHPSKTALEYLWRSGALTVTRREGFRKIYDLTENVIPPEYLNARMEDAEVIDWACGAALDRIGFGTSGEIAAFWDLVTPKEARDWCARQLAAGDLIEVDIGCAGAGPRRSFCRPALLEETPPDPTARIRVLSPFDPALRDRNRAERLFGFHYRIEVFVPEAKRQYGYYVFPVMEGARLIGRIDMKSHRDVGELRVQAFWPEAGIKLGPGRLARLEAELDRMARFAGTPETVFATDWIREPMSAS